jgi:pyruvate kinase
VKADSYEQAKKHLKLDGTEILLTRNLTSEHISLIPSLAGLLVEEESRLSPAEILAARPGIVFIADIPEAISQFEDNQLVTLEGSEKIIYEGFV